MYKTALLAALAAALAYCLFPLLNFKPLDVLTSLNLTSHSPKDILKTDDMAATSVSRRVVQKVLAVETAEVGAKRACREIKGSLCV